MDQHLILREEFDSEGRWALTECGMKVAIAQSGGMDADDVRLTMCQACEDAKADRAGE